MSPSLSMVQKRRKPRVTFPLAALQVAVAHTGPTEGLDHSCGVGFHANSRAPVSLEQTCLATMESTVEPSLSLEKGVILASNQDSSRNHVMAKVGTTSPLNADLGCSRGFPDL